MAIQRVKSKWAKTKVLLLSEPLRERIPVTRRWQIPQLASMLDEHGMVYVKPDQGTFGLGVVRVERLSDTDYTYQSGTVLQRFSSFAMMASSLQERIGSRSYLIQQGIPLLTYEGLRFDIRVMVQQNPKKEWETTGIIGRLSHPKKIVTNYHSGGVIMSIDQLMHPHLSQPQTDSYKMWLSEIGTSVARQLQTRYPRMKEIGIDVAIDESFRPWILEVNTLPDPFIFRKLNDKSVFRRIHRYCLAYGRRLK
ncbi:YheC/YheD family protein [Paenibacillus rhizovicinus]|uniref:YheC/YheD family protein n=1 Tax=Paenibacillus rhizovicinus TaxID=2704463 RepID=A0A6C0P125_9BACL|nr:YheC/YheD family protein [Paenibacillus rhizovicinus]QHW32184.1 YheC/YheD family protein [Paenibacillus rhizovicinus]